MYALLVKKEMEFPGQQFLVVPLTEAFLQRLKSTITLYNTLETTHPEIVEVVVGMPNEPLYWVKREHMNDVFEDDFDDPMLITAVVGFEPHPNLQKVEAGMHLHVVSDGIFWFIDDSGKFQSSPVEMELEELEGD